MGLLNVAELEQSSIVANCRMNRERDLAGSNGYDRELGFNPIDFLRGRTADGRETAWLDLCCGTGRALIQAAGLVHAERLDVEIVGVDLFGMFHRPDPSLTCLRLLEASLSTWRPDRRFDLITCVHGLHYVGDKIGLIARAASWLVEDGLLVANLDLHNLKFADGKLAGRRVAADLRRSGLEYDRRRRRVICRGRKFVDLPYVYVWVADSVGPNYPFSPSWTRTSRRSSDPTGRVVQGGVRLFPPTLRVGDRTFLSPRLSATDGCAPSDGPSLPADRPPSMSWRKAVEPLLLVGLDEPETAELRRRLDRPVLAFETLPRNRVDRGRLLVEHPNFMNNFVPVERVAYHAIFEDDFDFLTALALWGGPCLPGARGMMDLRLRLPGLVRALAVTQFGGIPRGYADRGTTVAAEGRSVARWGNWHCGEDKARFDGTWMASVPPLFEASSGGRPGPSPEWQTTPHSLGDT